VITPHEPWYGQLKGNTLILCPTRYLAVVITRLLYKDMVSVEAMFTSRKKKREENNPFLFLYFCHNFSQGGFFFFFFGNITVPLKTEGQWESIAQISHNLMASPPGI
jgi:hypothetical protein